MIYSNKPVSILITSAGRRVGLIKAFQASAKLNINNKVKILTVDAKPEYSSACIVSDGYFKISRIDSSSYKKELLDICIKNNVRLIIPTIDTELINLCNFKSEFEEKGIYIALGDIDFIKFCQDKRMLKNLFSGININIPKLYNTDELIFPLFMKPYDGSSSIGSKVIYSTDDLSKSDINNQKNIYQELVPSDWVEFSIDMYFNRFSKLCSCVPRLRLATRAGEISKSIIKKGILYELIVKKFEYFKGAKGVITLQVFANPDFNDLIAIEVNPRFGGGYPMSYAAGADFPSMLIREYLYKEDVDFFDSWDDDLIMLRYDEMVVIKSKY